MSPEASYSTEVVVPTDPRSPLSFSPKVVIPVAAQLLGLIVLGSYASEMIWCASVVLETELSVNDLRQIVFPHPTVSELIREAAWAVNA